MALFSLLIFVVNFLLVCYSIQKIIYIAHKKHLFDEPSEVRKIHLTKTPNLGGVAIFASMMFTSCLFFSYGNIPHLNYIIFSALMLFILGLTDDLVGVNPTKKIIAQLGVAIAITVFADCRFTHFYGFLGITEIPYSISIFISSLFIIFLINAFNLIDGINCLAGSIGLLICLTLAYYFWQMQQTGLLFIAMAIGGCLGGFLLFNKTPAKIFMGDTGSMFLGFIVAYLSINFIELNKPGIINLINPIAKSAPAIVLALLIVPVFDTLRIFSMRILKRKSPFEADSNHIHHRLIDLKFSHLQSTGILILVNIAAVALVFLIIPIKIEVLFFIIVAFALIVNTILSFFHVRRNNKYTKKQHYSSSYQLPKQLNTLNDKSILK